MQVITSVEQQTTVRNTWWVLRQAACGAVLLFAAVIFVRAGFVILAEQSLARAALAGLREATLPKATAQSTQAEINRSLSTTSLAHVHTTATLLVDGRKVTRPFYARPEQHVSLRLVAPSRSVLPGWIAAFDRVLGNAVIRVEVRGTGGY